MTSLLKAQRKSVNIKSERTFTRLFLVTCLVLLFLVLPTNAHAQAAVIHVGPTGNDTTGNGSLASPYATISKGVAAASASATVVVAPGTYTETVTITQRLTLKSESLQPANTIINAIGRSNGIVVLGSAAAGTVVEGFTVENADNHGIFVQDSSNVIIETNVVNNNGLNVIKGLGEDKAIQLTGTSNSTVAGNTVVGNLYGGIAVSDDGQINPSWNSTAVPSAGIPSGSARPGDGNIISGNRVVSNRPRHCAIVVSSYNQGQGVHNNIVSDNVVVDNQSGVIVAADTPNTEAVNNSVISNNIINNGEAGVVVHSNAPGDVVYGNAIIGNVISGNGDRPKLTGIIVGGEYPPAPVQSTTISGNTIQNEYYGILVVSGKQTLVGGNRVDATVRMPINGTVTAIDVTTTTSGGGQASINITSGGSITFSVALIAAVCTLIIGLIAGMIVRPPIRSRGNVA